MSETLKAQINRLANFIMAKIDGEPSRNEGAVDTAIRIMHGFIPGADVVVTPKGLEAGAAAACNAFNEMCDGVREDVPVDGDTLWGPREDVPVDGGALWFAVARAAIEAAGIHRVDEVVKAHVGGGVYAIDNAGNGYNVSFVRGDVLYIQRASIRDKEERE